MFGVGLKGIKLLYFKATNSIRNEFIDFVSHQRIRHIQQGSHRLTQSAE